MVAAGLGTAHVAVDLAAHHISWASTYAVSLGGLGLETLVDPKLPSDVGEFHGICEALCPPSSVARRSIPAPVKNSRGMLDD